MQYVGEGDAPFSGRKKLCKKDFPAMQLGCIIEVASASLVGGRKDSVLQGHEKERAPSDACKHDLPSPSLFRSLRDPWAAAQPAPVAGYAERLGGGI